METAYRSSWDLSVKDIGFGTKTDGNLSILLMKIFLFPVPFVINFMAPRHVLIVKCEGKTRF
jgi:hypothetical protein